VRPYLSTHIFPHMNLSEWVVAVSRPLGNFAAIPWREKVNFQWDDEIHWNNFPRINMSPHLDTLSCFRANQSLLFLLNYAWLEERQQIPILLSLVWPDRDPNPRSTALEVSSITITPPMRFIWIRKRTYTNVNHICWYAIMLVCNHYLTTFCT
jgi:hypothetical protein